MYLHPIWLKSYCFPTAQLSDLSLGAECYVYESDRFKVTDEITEWNWQLQNGHNYISCKFQRWNFARLGWSSFQCQSLLVFDNQLIFGMISYKELFQGQEFLSTLKDETSFPWILRKLKGKKRPRQLTFAIFQFSSVVRHIFLLSLNPLTGGGHIFCSTLVLEDDSKEISRDQ